MENLPRVIGPAPSELEQARLFEKLTRERSRVRGALVRFRESPPGPASRKKKAAPKKKRGPSKTALSKQQIALMEQHGLTLDQLEAFIKQGGKG